jgi:hypothetical protein
MPGIPDNVLSMLTQFPQETHIAQAYLQPIDLAPGESIPWVAGGVGLGVDSVPFDGLGAIAFQYWPESVQDTRSSEWSPKNIPGGSHPIYQWTHGGERRISFTAVFMTDTEPDESVFEMIDSGEWGVQTESPYTSGDFGLLSGIELGKRDIDLRAVVSWLRWFTYPHYGVGNDIRAYEPAKCLLVLPRTKLGYNGTDYVLSVMTQCDVTYEAWFVNGFPRIMEVALEFAEVVQEGAGVRFHDRADMQFSSLVGSFLGTKGTAR